MEDLLDNAQWFVLQIAALLCDTIFMSMNTFKTH